MTDADRRLAWLLGASGALPFLALAAWIAADLPRPWWLLDALTGYGALILSFLGGIRWGRALERGGGLDLALSVLPSLYAWPLLLLAPTLAWPLLAAGFVLQWLADEWRDRGRAPAWFLPLRRVLTTAVAGALLLAALALSGG